MKTKQVIIIASCPECGNQKWTTNEELTGEFQCADCKAIIAPENMTLTTLIAAERDEPNA